jgi:hypothetical protein
MSFVDKFKIPYVDGVEWDKTVGKPMVSRLGLCGNRIPSKSKAYHDKKSYLAEAKFLDTNDIQWYKENIDSTNWMDTICVREKGHLGKCKCEPYLPSGNDKISNGITQKLKDPLTNPGDDPDKGANRSHKRIFPLAFDKETRASWYEYNKSTGFLEQNQNIALRLPMVCTGLMAGLAYIDMYACILNSKGSDQYLDIPESFRNILSIRWEELKKLFEAKKIKIYDQDGFLQDPILWETIQIDWYGNGASDLKGIQFGHVDPIREDKWMTRPGNVLPITRETNLNQSSASLYDVMDRMRRSVQLQNNWENSLK